MQSKSWYRCPLGSETKRIRYQRNVNRSWQHGHTKCMLEKPFKPKTVLRKAKKVA